MVTEGKVLCEERRMEMGERKARRYLFGLCCVFILEQGGGGGVEGMITRDREREREESSNKIKYK